MMPPDLKVLVVGAGPTGLTLAASLARFGVRPRLIDRAVVPPVDRSRAVVLQARTLELFEDLDIAASAQAAGMTADGANFFTARGTRGHVTIRREWVESRYGGFVTLPQEETERILTGLVERSGVHVERGVELLSITQRDDGAEAVLALAGGGSETARFDWIVGCDGAHSAVRHAAGLAFPGVTYADECMVGDVDLAWAAPDDEVSICPAPDGVLLAFPLRGAHRFRVIMIVPASAPGEARALSADEFLAQLVRLAPRAPDGSPVPPRLLAARWLTRYRLHRRGVTAYRAGRVFVAGDAAHIHSPVGAQGMNTGIQDAWNLGWKLALVGSGRSPAWVLDSYHDERHRVGQYLLKNTDRMFAALAGGGRLGRFLRRLAPALGVRLIGAPCIGRRLARFVSQTGIRYRHSRLSTQGAGADALPRRAPRPGDRLPDVELGPDDRLAERLRGVGFRALLLAGSEPTRFAALTAIAHELRASHTGLLETLVLGTGGAQGDAGHRAHHRLAGADGALYLVRPDGYVAWRGLSTDADGLMRALDRLLPVGGAAPA